VSPNQTCGSLWDLWGSPLYGISGDLHHGISGQCPRGPNVPIVAYGIPGGNFAPAAVCPACDGVHQDPYLIVVGWLRRARGCSLAPFHSQTRAYQGQGNPPLAVHCAPHVMGSVRTPYLIGAWLAAYCPRLRNALPWPNSRLPGAGHTPPLAVTSSHWRMRAFLGAICPRSRACPDCKMRHI